MAKPEDTIPDEIERGIPMPRVGRRGTPYGVAWEDFEVGDSIFLEGYGHGRPAPGLLNFNASAVRRATPGKGWVARAITKDGRVGIRIWRKS